MKVMIGILIGATLLLTGLLAVALQRLYSVAPLHELKRLAIRGDHLARVLYRPASYGKSSRFFLWIVAVVGLASGVALLVRQLPSFLSVVLLLVVLAAVLVWLPYMRLTQHTAHIAVWFAPVVAWAVSHLHPVLGRAAESIRQRRDTSHSGHSRLYETEDVLDLLEGQKQQHDNRIPEETLDTIAKAVAFRDKHAGEVARSWSQAHLVDADETIGPLLLDRLHKQHQASFLVYKGEKDAIIGSLSLQDAVAAKHGGRVLDLVRSDLSYVHEDFTLPQVYAAFQKTGQQLLVVVNTFQEYTGVVTLNDVLQELVSLSEPESENISYENREAVAAFRPPLVPEVVEVPAYPDELPPPAEDDQHAMSKST